MSMSDPISDFLTRIRNAVKAGKKSVEMPSSKIRVAMSEILKDSAFIDDYSESENDKKFKMLTLRLKYSDGDSVILGLRRLSSPGLRRYVGFEDLPRVRNGMGIAIVSTSKGLMTDKQARKNKIGGEVMCEIW